MNRRNFFKTITGFAAGILAAFAPKAKGLTVADLEKCRDKINAKQQTGDILLPINSDSLPMYTPGDCIYYAPIDGVCKCKHKGRKWICMSVGGGFRLNADLSVCPKALNQTEVKGLYETT